MTMSTGKRHGMQDETREVEKLSAELAAHLLRAMQVGVPVDPTIDLYLRDPDGGRRARDKSRREASLLRAAITHVRLAARHHGIDWPTIRTWNAVSDRELDEATERLTRRSRRARATENR